VRRPGSTPAAAGAASAPGGQSTKPRRSRSFERQERRLRRKPRRAPARSSRGHDLWDRARAALGRVPRAAWVCAALAVLNAVCWSLLMPPFQVTDEPSHFAYVQQLAENDALPSSSEITFSPEQEAVLRDIRQYEVRQSPELRTIASAAEQQRLQEDLQRKLSRHGEGGVGGSYSDPPLYYALQTIPYALASGGTLLDQLEAMRVLSALMAGLTALFAFLFVREALPRERWAWTVAGLAVALAPLLAFVSGAVTPDAMLTAVAAISFYLLARAFRRGLTPALAIAIGALLAVGFITKDNFVGLAPGIVLGLVLLSVRAARAHGARAYRWLAGALAIAFSPVLVYVLANLASGSPALGVASKVLKLHGASGSLLDKLGYVWQYYLPRLPGTHDYFPGVFPLRDLWFNHGVGFYGWIDTAFPGWVQSAALAPTLGLAALCAWALFAERAALRQRLAEALVYVAIAVGLLVLIGITSYVDRAEGEFSSPRYLLPLIPLLGLALALAVRGAGRRAGPALGAGIVVLFAAHDIFSQLLVAGRYYG
jgi:predicted membrane protein DUF2142